MLGELEGQKLAVRFGRGAEVQLFQSGAADPIKVFDGERKGKIRDKERTGLNPALVGSPSDQEGRGVYVKSPRE